MTLSPGKKAPSFKANAIINGYEKVRDFSLDKFLGDQYVLFIFYPEDFSSVCPIELNAFQERIEEFKSRNCAVVACSTDSVESHLAWLKTDTSSGGIKGVTYPLVADNSKTISDAFGVLAGEYEDSQDGALVANGPMIAYRGLFLIDKQGIVQYQSINNFLLMRSADEALRMVDALQYFEENGEVCPLDFVKNAVKA